VSTGRGQLGGNRCLKEVRYLEEAWCGSSQGHRAIFEVQPRLPEGQRRFSINPDPPKSKEFRVREKIMLPLPQSGLPC